MGPRRRTRRPIHRTGPTIAPFLGALAIIVLVVIGIVVVNVFSGSDPTSEQQVRGAVVGQNDALQRADYADFRDFTCRAAQGNEADVLADQRDSVEKKGNATSTVSLTYGSTATGPPPR